VLGVLAGENDGEREGRKETAEQEAGETRSGNRKESKPLSGFPVALGQERTRLLHRYRKGREGGRDEGTERVRAPRKVQIVASEGSRAGVYRVAGLFGADFYIACNRRSIGKQNERTSREICRGSRWLIIEDVRARFYASSRAQQRASSAFRLYASNSLDADVVPLAITIAVNILYVLRIVRSSYRCIARLASV